MIQRNIQEAVRAAISDTPVVLLNGARQTGKTTLAQEMASVSGAQYFTLDDAATLSFAANDPSGFIRNLTGKFLAGIVLYTGDQLIPFGDKLWLVPLPALWAE